MLPLLVVLALGIGSTALMVAVLVGLVRNLKVLSRSVATFRADVEPLLEDVRKGTEASQEVLQRLSSRQLGAGPDDRIRR